MSMKDAVNSAAKDYIASLEKLVVMQSTMLKMTTELENKPFDLDPVVWEVVGRHIYKKYGQGAHNALPLVMLAIDVYLYSVDQLDDENYIDIVQRLDEFVKCLKAETEAIVEGQKALNNGWMN